MILTDMEHSVCEVRKYITRW